MTFSREIEFRKFLIGLLLIGSGVNGQEKNKDYNMSSFQEKGEKAPSENFTGTVWVNINVSEEDNYNTVIGAVTFEPKARTNWHTHETGQILMVISGAGYYQEEGKPIQLIREGDVIKIGKNENHWHGGSRYQAMSHIAVVPELDKGRTIWGVAVDDETYNNYQASVDEVDNYLSPTAIKNHENLWPEHASMLKRTGISVTQEL